MLQNLILAQSCQKNDTALLNKWQLIGRSLGTTNKHEGVQPILRWCRNQIPILDLLSDEMNAQVIPDS